jgi:hypothetical protein
LKPLSPCRLNCPKSDPAQPTKPGYQRHESWEQNTAEGIKKSYVTLTGTGGRQPERKFG